MSGTRTTPGEGDVLLEALAPLLRQHLDPAARPLGLHRAPTGNSQETWLLSVDVDGARHELVVRRSAVGGTLEWSDRGAEVDVMERAGAAGLPVPRTIWWEPDGGSLERAYVVMERAPGAAPDLRSAAVSERLAGELGTMLAVLHRLATPGTDSLESTAGELERWTERAHALERRPAALDAMLGWLHATLPDLQPSPAVQLWGDPGPHNVLTDAEGRITAVLDWELARAGHPLEDVGAARWSCLGHLDRDAVVAAYTAGGGEHPHLSTLDWFEVLACVSRSVMLLDGVAAIERGASSDPNVLGLAATMVPTNMLHAMQLAWSLTPDPTGNDPADDGAAGDHGVVDPALLVGTVKSFLRETFDRFGADGRSRGRLKIAGALLDTLAAGVADGDAHRAHPAGSGPGGHTDADWFTTERTGSASTARRARLVAATAAERARWQPLLDLYGAAVRLRFDAAG